MFNVLPLPDNYPFSRTIDEQSYSPYELRQNALRDTLEKQTLLSASQRKCKVAKRANISIGKQTSMFGKQRLLIGQGFKDKNYSKKIALR